MTTGSTHADPDAESVDKHLREAADCLRRGLEKADAVGYGNQFRNAIRQALRDVEYARGMLP